MADVTLLELAKTKPEQEAKVINAFAMEYTAGALLGYAPVVGFDYPFTVFDTLPTITPRDFNADYTSDYGSSSTYRVPWKNYGGKLSIDRALKLGNPRGAAIQEMLQLSAIAKKWNIDMFEGTGGTSLKGVKDYLADIWSGQLVNAGTTDGGDALTLAMMDDLMALVDEPSGLFMTEAIHQRLTVLARTSTVHNIQFGVDSFGNQVEKYAGVPIYKMKDGETGSDILSTTELGGSGSTATASTMYLVSFREDGFHGFAPNGEGLNVTVSNPGTNFDITRIEKHAGVVLEQRRAAAALRYLLNT